MKKETVDRKLDRLNWWIRDNVEMTNTRRIPRREIRAIMVDQMGWVDERTQDKWIDILVRRKLLVPLNAEQNVFYVPEAETREQKVLETFDPPQVKLEK